MNDRQVGGPHLGSDLFKRMFPFPLAEIWQDTRSQVSGTAGEAGVRGCKQRSTTRVDQERCLGRGGDLPAAGTLGLERLAHVHSVMCQGWADPLRP